MNKSAQTPKEMRRLILEALHLRMLKKKLSKRKDKDGNGVYQMTLDKIKAREG